jgi:hypothetical protein
MLVLIKSPKVGKTERTNTLRFLSDLRTLLTYGLKLKKPFPKNRERLSL